MTEKTSGGVNFELPVVAYFPESEQRQAEHRTAGDVEKTLRARANQTLSWMQPGLVYPAPWQCALSVSGVPKGATRADFAALISAVRRTIHAGFGKCHGSVCAAFSLALWTRFCAEDSLPLPKGMAFAETHVGHEPEVIARSGGVLQNSGFDAWFIVKADSEEAVSGIVEFLAGQLRRFDIKEDQVYRVNMQSRNNPSTQKGDASGRVLGGRFRENLRNPGAPVEILEHILVGGEDPASAGGAFVFTQRFNLNWAELHSKTATELESAVGRHQYTDELVPSFDARSHIRSAHAYDASGNTIKLLRVGLPFGTRGGSVRGTPLIEHAGASSRNDESGIYFVGIARAAGRIETILRSQFDGTGMNGFGRDRLLAGNVARSDLGGFFYAPSIRELPVEAYEEDLQARRNKNFDNWSRFPGVDWARLNRHYDQRSANGRMFYNHQDYLHIIGTRPHGVAEAPKAPSLRVQFLLERLFSKWDDTWFRSQKPDELQPLRPQLVRFFSDPANAAECRSILAQGGGRGADGAAAVLAADLVMREPVSVRSAWAGRLLCNLAARIDGVGHRGNGGMDTCDIHPLDLLAGSMPAQSLAEGKYFIDYVADDDGEAERYRWFALGLGPSSGVGHVVPGYEDMLKYGIKGLYKRIDDAEHALRDSDSARATAARPFYAGARLAAQGLAGYLAGLADTVANKAQTLAPDGHLIERNNLAALEARLRRLAGGEAPGTVLEALQLVLAGHVTLHLCGEPVAVGRLDRLIRPFQQIERLSQDDLQDAIDCFWLKLGEKVLLNRIFIDDRQQLGNLAMGNRAGPYPKGQSVNQWIQQLTVGGKNADGSWEYSDVTLACLRASARLPFNAPVLSLRVSKDMPPQWRTLLLEEAAKAQLSGGASPILLNDDKIIPGLERSGDAIGPAAGSPAAKLWQSKVRAEDAHDYACDGCYEPQFVGANWFHLGGAVLLQPLEYAVNQGRQIIGSGPVDLLGKNMSFRSPPAYQIESYEELEQLFFKHFEWSYAKQMEGTVADFGRMAQVCPAPLLNLFINDCLAKGQDIYAGGARYNVLGPCFTALGNAINALWAMRVMCFNQDTSVTTLAELTQALLCNWGESMIDPLVHTTVLTADPSRVADPARRFRHLRSVALSLPRWGRGDAQIDAFGNAICARIASIAVKTMSAPRPGLAGLFEQAATRFGTEQHPFGGFCMQPGVGTFASYVEQGIGCGASADGRLAGQPLATDMSPTPSPLDFPATPASQQIVDGIAALEGIRSDDSFGFSNGAPIDINVSEGMTVDRLVEILDAFTDGAGSNILTVTVANQDTFLSAANSPEAYDLLRVRMGGWTEMFVAMHSTHQKVHPRRPYSR